MWRSAPQPRPGAQTSAGGAAAIAAAGLRARDGAGLFTELEESESAASESSWTVGYLDLLLLLLTLFAILLAVTYMQVSKTPPQTTQVLDMRVPLPNPPTPARLDLDPQVLLAALQTRPRPPAPAAPPASPVPDPKPAPSPPQATVPAPAIPAAPAPTPSPDLAGLAQRLVDRVGGLLELSLGDRELRMELRDNILFPLGSADLGLQGRALLDQLADLLRLAPDTQLAVEGHTDDLPIANPRFPSNWELSSFRATRVARYLIERGIPAERLRTTGYADTRPRVANDSPEHRSRNRRVSIVLYPDAAKASGEPLAGPGWRDL